MANVSASKDKQIREALEKYSYFDLPDHKKKQVRNELGKEFDVDPVWLKDVFINNIGKNARRISDDKLAEILGVTGADLEIDKFSEDPAEGIAEFKETGKRVYFVSSAPTQAGIGMLKAISERDKRGASALLIVNNGEKGALDDESFQEISVQLAKAGIYSAAVHSGGVSRYAPDMKLTVPAGAQGGSLAELAKSFAEALTTAELSSGEAKLPNRIVACLLAKPFLILTGLSGSGKTKFAQAFARWITPKIVDPPNQYYSVVPVGADWTGNENILGYASGLDDEAYITKPALEIALHATADKDHPHFLILDEMNLSHVERYFADFLSGIESQEPIRLHSDEDRSAGDVSIPSSLALPSNLFIIGTVNIDETTYMFSPKVLDRANVIEFRVTEGDFEHFLQKPSKPELSRIDAQGEKFASQFLMSATSTFVLPPSAEKLFTSEVLLFFGVMERYGGEFGYRVAFEASRFLALYRVIVEAPAADDAWFNEAFDFVVIQKLLPKLHGTRGKLGPLLKALWFLCVNDVTARGDNPSEAANQAAHSLEKAHEPSRAIPMSAPYPHSAAKIARMWTRMNEHGFASFAEA